jgi:hypothetical protein
VFWSNLLGRLFIVLIIYCIFGGLFMMAEPDLSGLLKDQAERIAKLEDHLNSLKYI